MVHKTNKMIQKKLIIFVSLFTFIMGFAQKKIPVIKSNTLKVSIIEDGLVKTVWNLDSTIKPDTYNTGKITKRKSIKLITDIDSIEIKLKPEQKFDFIVLYKHKDSCYTRFQAPKRKSIVNTKKDIDTVSFVLTDQNNIILKTIFNKKDTLNLVFDTGASGFHLTKEVIKKEYNPNDSKEKITMSDLAKNQFQIGNMIWNDQQIYPIGEIPEGASGLLGWDIFDEKIVEIDYDKNILILYDKKSKIDKKYQSFNLKFIREQFFITSQLQIKKQKFENIFLFDTGYQRTVLIDKDIARKQKYPDEKLHVIAQTTLKNSRNEDVKVVTLLNERINFGKYSLTNVPVQLLSSSNPLGFNAHFLGNEVLKRFNTILDFQHNVVYLAPNKYFHEDYAEKK